MKIQPFQPENLSAAAALFIAHFAALRHSVPSLPGHFEAPPTVIQRLTRLTSENPCFAALEDGRLVGYLGGYILNDLRGMGRKSIFCPEWGHGAQAGRKGEIYRALYRAAAQAWTPAGVRTHALSVLATDDEARNAWFWNGFGLLVVDAIRGMAPLGAVTVAGITLRQAGASDMDTVTQLETEHRDHYSQPPVLMRSSIPEEPVALRRLVEQADTIWLAEWQGEAVGLLRLETCSDGAAEIVQAPGSAAITGLFVRPRARGLGVAPALLEAALTHYRQRGCQRCSVDFESFNPTAAAFWMKYFQPVCYSLIRHPESLL